MQEASSVAIPELPNILSLLSASLRNTAAGGVLRSWENLVFSGLAAGIILFIAYRVSRRHEPVPGRLQNAAEMLAEGMDGLVCGILGKKHGRKYLPFLGTLFIYILFMNLCGMVPFLKSATSGWSTTAALALCVFFYVNYTAVRELGVGGYIDHLAGRPRGIMAVTAVLPVMMFILHTFSELVRPVTLSLRLRSNVWGDDVLMALFAGFGIKGFPLLFFNTVLALLSAVVQAVVFFLLSTIYFALVLEHDEDTAGGSGESAGKMDIEKKVGLDLKP